MIDQKDIIYQARLHWVLFVPPAILFLVTFYLGLQYEQFRTPSFILALVGIFWEAIIWMSYQFTLLIIKKKQVILCTGVLVRQTLDIPLNKIESIDIRQSVMGSLFQYGSLVITGTGGSRQYVNFLSHPLTARRYIEQLLHE